MSKIVCDVCGTPFAETEDQCPICGTAKTESTRSASGTDSGYAYVKGGRFSQSNVRKHNSGKQELPRVAPEEKAEPQQPAEEVVPVPVEDKPVAEKPEPRRPAPQRPVRAHTGGEPQKRPVPTPRPRREEPQDEQPSNLGLIIIVVVLLVAIIAVCAYIGIYVYDKYSNKPTDPNADPGSTSSQPLDVPCTGISVAGGVSTYTFTELGQEWQIEILAQPANTTDELDWEYDENVVKVEARGNYWCITPVGPGETEIVVSCGEHSATLNVVSELTNVPCNGISINGPASYSFTSAEPLSVGVICDPVFTTDEITWTYDQAVISIAQDGEQWVITPLVSGTTTATVTCGEYSASMSITVNLEADFVLKWACNSDITLSGYGTSWRIYNGEVPVENIVFTSSDESIATVKDGRVYIWANGKVTITATYGTQTITMTVRANNVEKPADGAPNYSFRTNYGTKGNEFTIHMGDKLTLTLIDENGVKITEGVKYYVAEGETHISVDASGKITTLSVVKAGSYVYAEYQGHVYKCLIRVYDAKTE